MEYALLTRQIRRTSAELARTCRLKKRYPLDPTLVRKAEALWHRLQVLVAGRAIRRAVAQAEARAGALTEQEQVDLIVASLAPSTGQKAPKEPLMP